MLKATIKKVFGTKQDRDIKHLNPLVKEINSWEERLKSLSDEQLQNKTPEFRKRLQEGSTLDQLLVEAFAVVREASTRVLGMRPYDVQLMGAITLHEGKIAEMKTGEGKTLTATMPLYLNALSGKGAHLVTVNDYLAQRDADEMGVLYNWLGLSVDCIVHDLDDQRRQEAYSADITYGTNNEFAFDYLRDNMKFDLQNYVQRELNFCIVDEVDSILIDEARTPLLISGPSEGRTDLYYKMNDIIPQLAKETHFTVDEKSHSAILTEDGIIKVQDLLQIPNLFEPEHSEVLHHVNQALKAHTLFQNDVNYVVREGRVIIVDEFTGRLKHGSRWSDGLHQAVEAKEGVDIKRENQTLASITFQNYFKLYNKLSGMTGTADTEAEEFHKIYTLDVTVIPTNLPLVRSDEADVIYVSKDAKYKAAAETIKKAYDKGQPVLVGTISIESSEILSKYLSNLKIPHEILNAKQHEREADIITKAGESGSITIATNMAGRGTDIKLSKATKNSGGLFILGTERHESRRIDNQLRGRSGRQGDPGRSKFFLSLEDDLMRIFGSDKIKNIMSKLGMKDDEPIEHKMISNAIAKAQKRVETHNFDIRKHLLDYDNVMNEQRQVIYRLRRDILGDEENKELIDGFIEDVCFFLGMTYTPDKKVPMIDWNWEEIKLGFKGIFYKEYDFNSNECSDKFDSNLPKYLLHYANVFLQEKLSSYPQDQVKLALREVLLSTFDSHWKDHLLAMDHLKEGIGLRSYGQKDPLIEYKREAFDLFEQMKETIKRSAVETLFRIRLYTQEEVEAIKKAQQQELEEQLNAHRNAQAADQKQIRNPIKRDNQKVGRNDPCPCGSGKKFKHCHG
jgi:preprotein translocase subunit SecA